MRVTPYLHDTVTSILVAGTLVLRGSNSPIDAIISTQHAQEDPHRNKGQKEIRIVIAVNPLWRCPLDVSREEEEREREHGGEAENDTDRARGRVRGRESWEADLKFIHPPHVDGALRSACLSGAEEEESAANRRRRQQHAPRWCLPPTSFINAQAACYYQHQLLRNVPGANSR